MKQNEIYWWKELIQIIPYLDEDYQLKMDFVKFILKSSLNKNVSDDMKIKIRSIRVETLIYIIYAIITKYDEWNGKPGLLQDNSSLGET